MITDKKVALFFLGSIMILLIFFVGIDSVYGGFIFVVLLLGVYVVMMEVEVDEKKLIGKKDLKRRVSTRLSVIKQKDDNFSLPIFLDYAQMLFLKTYYSCPDTEKVSKIEPFFSYDLKKLKPTVYSQVVVEKAEITDIKSTGGKCNIAVNFSAYFAAKYKQDMFHCRAEEEWLFSRQANAVSSVPNGFGVLRCSKCGRYLDFDNPGKCTHCGAGQTFENGQWVVSDIKRKQIKRLFPEKELITYRPEKGTSDPSLITDNIKTKEHDFFKIQNYKLMSFRDFENRIAKEYFVKIYNNFSSGQWNSTRHLIYENTWQNIKFMLSEYHRYGYKRIIDNLEVTKTETVNYEKDNFYQTLTVRIFAECYDYVVNYETGIIGGSNRQKRYFSQYWTFLSCIGFTGKITDTELCPSCGKKVGDIDNSGICPYCMNRVNDGNFSWVLYSITEDEDYFG